MGARQHTDAMLGWWATARIDRVDLAVRRPDACMIWHHDQPTLALPLAWCRAENVQCGDVYARPARGHAWPLVLLDDVQPQLARRIASRYSALVVHTSSEGGCHVWLRCSQPLDEPQRQRAQTWLATRCQADRGSVSGEHLGRLAGFRNWKRNGVWVNVIAASRNKPSWEPDAANTTTIGTGQVDKQLQQSNRTGVDTSPSGREWGWACGLLEDGVAPELVYRQLLESAFPRRNRDAERYARRTIEQAVVHVRRNHNC
jgi:hypothetical protein